MENGAFVALILFRWAAQIIFARRGTFEGPRDVLTAILFVMYVTFLGLAWSCDVVHEVSVVILFGAVVLRCWAIASLGAAFSHSVNQEITPAVVAIGPYRLMRNPLLLAYWMELLAFAVSFPLPVGSRIAAAIFAGLICAWHAHEDNIRLAIQSEAYRAYMQLVRNHGLGLFFPSHAQILSWRVFSLDTYSAYVFSGFLAGQILALGYGLPGAALLVLVPSAFLGAFVYWRLTAPRSKLRYGFSFFGGMIASTFATLLLLVYWDRLSPDMLAGLAIALSAGHAVGRLGCIGHGCCTGASSPQHKPYFIHYADPNQRINRVHETKSIYATPTVVLEALGQCIIAFTVFLWPRFAAVIWLVGYGALRGIIQSLRAEAGDLSRMIPSALLLIIGGFFSRFLVPENAPNFRSPTGAEWSLAAILSLLVALAYGLRMKPKVLLSQ